MHFGLFSSDTLIGILSIYKKDHQEICASDGWQLRAMGIREGFRGKGYASRLLRAAESEATNRGAQWIWANARRIAVGFYQERGYSILGGEFTIQDIGPHYLVYKNMA